MCCVLEARSQAGTGSCDRSWNHICHLLQPAHPLPRHAPGAEPGTGYVLPKRAGRPSAAGVLAVPPSPPGPSPRRLCRAAAGVPPGGLAHVALHPLAATALARYWVSRRQAQGRAAPRLARLIKRGSRVSVDLHGVGGLPNTLDPDLLLLLPKGSSLAPAGGLTGTWLGPDGLSGGGAGR